MRYLSIIHTVILNVLISGVLHNGLMAQCIAPAIPIEESVCLSDTLSLAAPNNLLSSTWDLCSGDLFQSFSAVTLGNTNINTPRILSIPSWSGANIGFAYDANAGALSRLAFNASFTSLTQVTPLEFTSVTGPISSSSWARIKFLQQNGNWFGFTSTEGNVLVRYEFPSSGLLADTIAYSSFNNSFGLDFSGPRDLDLLVISDTIYLMVVNRTSSKLNIISLADSATNTPTLSVQHDLTGISQPNSISIQNQCGNYFALVTSQSHQVYFLEFGTSIANTPQITEISPSSTFTNPTKVFLTRENNQWLGIVKHRTNSLELSRIFFGDSLSASPDSILQYDNLGGTMIGWAMDLVEHNSETYLVGIKNSNQKPVYALAFDNPCTGVDTTYSGPTHAVQLPSVGTYFLEYTLTDSIGNVTTKTDTILSKPKVNTNFSLVGSCAQSSFGFADLSTSIGAEITSRQWQIDTLAAFIDSAFQYAFPFADTFQLQLSATNDQGCVGVLDTQVIAHPSPSLVIGIDSACRGADLVITNNSFISFDSISHWQWNFGNGDSVFTANPTYHYLDTGVQTVIVRAESNFGCSALDTLAVYIKDAPIANFSIDHTCIGDSTVFTNQSGSTVPYSIFWALGDGNFSTLDSLKHVYASGGSYLVQLALSATNGCFDSTALEISVTSAPTAAIASVSAIRCEGQPIQLVTGSGAGTTELFWRVNAGFIGSGDTLHYQPDSSGSFSLQHIVNSGYSCFDTVGQMLNVNAKPNFSIDINDQCEEDSLSMISSPVVLAPQSAESFDWNVIGIAQLSGAEATLVFPSDGNFAVSHTLTTDSGCFRDTTFNVRIFDRPVVSIVAAALPLCSGLENEFAPSSYIDPLDSILADTIFGTYPSGTSVIYPADSGFLVTESGMLSIQYKIVTRGGCSVSTTKAFAIQQSPEIQISDDTICINSPFEFSDNYSGSNYGRLWQFGDGTVSTVSESFHFYPDTGKFDGRLTLTDITNGCYDTSAFSVTVLEKPIAYLLDDQFCEEGSDTLSLRLASPFDRVSAVNWTFADGSQSSRLKPVRTFPSVGVYSTFIEYSTEIGCQNTQSLPFTVLSSPVFSFNVSPEQGTVPADLLVEVSSENPPAASAIAIGNDTFTDVLVASSQILNPALIGISISLVDSSGCATSKTFEANFLNAKLDAAISIEDVQPDGPFYKVTGTLVNSGNVEIRNVQLSLDGKPTISLRKELSETLLPAAQTSIEFDRIELSSAPEYLCMRIDSVNGALDAIAANNTDCTVRAPKLKLLNAYPNPSTSGWVNLMMATGDCDEIEGEILDATGKVFHQFDLVSNGNQLREFSISTANLPVGIYIIKVMCEDSADFIKFSTH